MKIENSKRHLLVSEVDFEVFSKTDFQALSNKYEKKTIVLHDENLNRSLNAIKENFKDDYFVQLGFTACKNDIAHMNESINASLVEKNYKNSASAFEDIKNTYTQCRNHEWFNYIPEAIHLENISYLERELSLSRTLTLIDSSNQVNAVLMIFNSLFFTDEPVDQIGWVWIKSDISKELRMEAHAKLSSWFKENLRKKFYQAGVHIENSRSQKFFQKMGFKVKCAHITKR